MPQNGDLKAVSSSGSDPSSKGSYPHVTEEEYVALLEGCRDLDLRFWLQIMWITGCRTSEALALTAGDVHRQGQEYQLSIHRTKRRAPVEDRLPIPHEFGEKLTELIQVRDLDRSDRLLSLERTTAYRRLRRLAQDVLGKHVHPHMFRHGRVYHLARNGTSPTVVAKIVGHVHVQTTLGYYSSEEDDLRDAINK